MLLVTHIKGNVGERKSEKEIEISIGDVDWDEIEQEENIVTNFSVSKLCW